MSGADTTAGKGRKPDARTLAQQLRANLKRRKQQARARHREEMQPADRQHADNTGSD